MDRKRKSICDYSLPQPQELSKFLVHSLPYSLKHEDEKQKETKAGPGEIDLRMFSNILSALPRSASQQLSSNQMNHEFKPMQNKLQHMSDQQCYQGQNYAYYRS